jgi:hypothetical protein
MLAFYTPTLSSMRFRLHVRIQDVNSLQGVPIRGAPSDSTVQQSEAGEALHALDDVKFFLTRERLREVIVKV